MIHVQLAPEPEAFEAKVRAPGLSAIAELIGEPPTLERPDPKRKAVARHRDELQPEYFPPFWRNATDDLLTAYGRICAYACLYIHRLTGAATVDHWAPKSKAWDRVYEWSNYRLACSLMNARKNTFADVIDPFDVYDGLFALDLVTLEVVPGPKAGARKEEVKITIKRLGLDGSDYAEALADHFHPYLEGHIDFHQLEKLAPFLARELQRQGKLRNEGA